MMDAEYLAEEVQRLEESERYLRGRYEYFMGKYEDQVKQTAALVEVLKKYRGVPVAGVGNLADAALDKLMEKELGKRKSSRR